MKTDKPYTKCQKYVSTSSTDLNNARVDVKGLFRAEKILNNCFKLKLYFCGKTCLKIFIAMIRYQLTLIEKN